MNATGIEGVSAFTFHLYGKVIFRHLPFNVSESVRNSTQRPCDSFYLLSLAHTSYSNFHANSKESMPASFFAVMKLFRRSWVGSETQSFKLPERLRPRSQAFKEHKAGIKDHNLSKVLKYSIRALGYHFFNLYFPPTTSKSPVCTFQPKNSCNSSLLYGKPSAINIFSIIAICCSGI